MRYALNVTPINGWETQFGFGQVAAQDLGAAGAALIAVQGAGASAMQLGASGVGYLRIHGAGAAPMVMDGAGYGAIAIRGEGVAPMVLAGLYGIPSPKLVPAEFGPAHRSCVLRVPRENNTIRVEREAAIV